MSYIIDIQQGNGSWYTEVTTTADEAYALVCALDYAAQVLINDEPVNTQEAIDAWYSVQTSTESKPVDVDMGGDFEGFIEAVNAQPTAQVWYTEPVTSADGEKIMARVTTTDNGHVVEVLANGIAIIDQTETHYFRGIAIDAAEAKAIAYMLELNRQRAIEMGDETETPASNYNNPWDYDEDEARVKKHDRMAEIRRKLERLDRERDSLLFELAQLTGE